MTFPNLSPYVLGLHWGMFGVRWYALAYVAGILLGWRYLIGLVKNPRLWGEQNPTLTVPQIDDLVLWVTAGIILGGRLGYILFYDTSVIWTDPLQIPQVWLGGMSFHGGVIGVSIVILLFARFNKISILRLADVVTPAVPIGMFFGRIANFINGELWGRPTSMPWGMIFCNKTIEDAHGGTCSYLGGPGYLPRHPSQIYEALLEGLLVFVILRFVTHRKLWLQRKGAVAGLFLVAITLCRIFVEFFRNPDYGFDTLPFSVTMGQILSVPVLIVGAVLLWRGLKASVPEAFVAPEAAPSAKPAKAKAKAAPKAP